MGSRGTASLEKFLQKISHLDVKTYATDAWKAYNLIDPKKHITGKAHTYTAVSYTHLRKNITPHSPNDKMVNRDFFLFLEKLIFAKYTGVIRCLL